MTTPADIEALAQRVEREEPSGVLWLHAYDLTHLEAASNPEERYRLVMLMRDEACRDAAAMLMPEGWFCDLDDQGNGEVVAKVWRIDHDIQYLGAAKGPHSEARARLAAALRAHARGAP